MLKKLTGTDCPGCGTQRSIMLFFEGEFWAAFKMFPAIYSSILLLVVIALHFLDKSRNYHIAIRTMAILNAVIMIIAYIYKLTTIN